MKTEIGFSIILRCLPLLFLGLFFYTASARGDSTNLVLVVNSNLPESLALANQYIHDRKIPASNVIYIDFELKKENTNLGIFKQKILIPVLKAIEERGLQNQINIITYSSGFPTRISCDSKSM